MTRRAIDLNHETIDAIAQRVIELLASELANPAGASTLIDGGELARRTGISRAWIYQHADQLGAIRLSDGPRARLRFPPDAVERLRSDANDPPPTPRGPATRPERRRPRTERPELLPIKGARGLSRRALVRRSSH